MEDRKLLFFDIDGTLLSEKTHTVPQSTKEALKKRKKKDILFLLIPVDLFLQSIKKFTIYNQMVIFVVVELILLIIIK